MYQSILILILCIWVHSTYLAHLALRQATSCLTDIAKIENEETGDRSDD